jgi:hypothetical protein
MYISDIELLIIVLIIVYSITITSYTLLAIINLQNNINKFLIHETGDYYDTNRLYGNCNDIRFYNRLNIRILDIRTKILNLLLY